MVQFLLRLNLIRVIPSICSPSMNSKFCFSSNNGDALPLEVCRSCKYTVPSVSSTQPIMISEFFMPPSGINRDQSILWPLLRYQFRSSRLYNRCLWFSSKYGWNFANRRQTRLRSGHANIIEIWCICKRLCRFVFKSWIYAILKTNLHNILQTFAKFDANVGQIQCKRLQYPYLYTHSVTQFGYGLQK